MYFFAIAMAKVGVQLRLLEGLSASVLQGSLIRYVKGFFPKSPKFNVGRHRVSGDIRSYVYATNASNLSFFPGRLAWNVIWGTLGNSSV